MVGARLPAFVASMLVCSFAGCAESPEVDAASVITEPTDYSYLENATTDGSGWHVHDYWKGQDSLVLFDETRDIDFSCPGCTYVSYGFGASRLPAGTVVPQGASHVVITATYEFDGPHPEPALSIKTAADVEAASIGSLESGKPLQFNSSHEQNDPPHQSLSGWAFPVTLSGAGDQYEFSGSIRIHIEAFRGLEIPEWPPHPDLWGGSDEIPLFDGREGRVLYMEQVDGGYTCYGICEWQTHSPDDGKLVPFDAARVRVQLTYEAGLPAGLALTYHGADAWDRIRVEATDTGPGTATFEIPVSYLNGDSPYAKQSLWEFRVAIDEQPVDPSRWSGGYTLSAVALRS